MSSENSLTQIYIMTILFFSRLFYPHIGGVEKHVLEISKILIQKGHQVVVFTEQYDSKLKLQERIEGIDTYRIPVGTNAWFKKFQIWFWLWHNRKLIKKADLVHAHDVFFWYLPFRFLYPKKPVYTTFHGYEDYPLKSRWVFARRIWEKLSYGTICVGEFMKKWYGTKPTFVTYGGINIGKIRNSNIEIRNKFKIQNSRQRRGSPKAAKFKILFIGRLDEQTGIMDYLKAVKILKDKGYKTRLDVLGDGIQRNEAKKFCVEFNLDVKFHGFLSNINDFLVKSNFVFVSRYLGILETMAAKKLVFSLYNNDIKRNYLEMSPFAELVVIANSAEEIYSKVVYYLKNPNEEKIIVDKAYNWVKDQTWDRVFETYIRLWNKDKR